MKILILAILIIGCGKSEAVPEKRRCEIPVEIKETYPLYEALILLEGLREIKVSMAEKKRRSTCDSRLISSINILDRIGIS